MPRYLVLANQTAASPELTSAVREIVAQDADTEFVLLVPATPVEDLLDWQDGDSETIAMRTAQAAKDHLAGAGAKVARTEVGDASPVKAIENELEQHQEKYDGIIISTLPLQRSRWVALDQPRRIERRFKVPVRHVVGHSVTMTREDLINGLNGSTLTRAQVLRAIVQSDQITQNLEAVNAFVASQYYGYLRRTPEASGFNDWVNYLKAHPTDFRTMVHGFVDSIEYRLRFGPVP